mmetsp:Transcript_93562/g.190468  ORF Transcript_93562/g.190468 Transcript_93562/m.190468 type:complete len:82 (+) Transcript_93562:20-265(+)
MLLTCGKTSCSAPSLMYLMRWLTVRIQCNHWSNLLSVVVARLVPLNQINQDAVARCSSTMRIDAHVWQRGRDACPCASAAS